MLARKKSQKIGLAPGSLVYTGEQKDAPVGERIEKGRGRIRKSGADYPAYALMDMIVDHYFAVLEESGEDIGTLQEEALHDQHAFTGESPLIGRYVMVCLKDVYDHVIQVIDDGFVKSPISALRCISRNFTYDSVRCIPRDLRRLDLELFTLPSKF